MRLTHYVEIPTDRAMRYYPHTQPIRLLGLRPIPSVHAIIHQAKQVRYAALITVSAEGVRVDEALYRHPDGSVAVCEPSWVGDGCLRMSEPTKMFTKDQWSQLCEAQTSDLF